MARESAPSGTWWSRGLIRPISDHDFVLTHHLFAGIEYFATEHLLFGMRYRLVNIGETGTLSNRALQMLEFSCGYQY